MIISNTAYSKLRMWCHHKWVEFSSHRNSLIPAATTQNYFRVSVVGNWQSICKNCCDHGVIDPTRTCATSYPSLFVLGSTDLLSTCLAVVADHIYLYKSGSLSVFICPFSTDLDMSSQDFLSLVLFIAFFTRSRSHPTATSNPVTGCGISERRIDQDYLPSTSILPWNTKC